MTGNSTQILGLVSYQTLHYFFLVSKCYIIFTLCVSARNVKQLNNIYIVVQKHFFLSRKLLQISATNSKFQTLSLMCLEILLNKHTVIKVPEIVKQTVNRK